MKRLLIAALAALSAFSAFGQVQGVYLRSTNPVSFGNHVFNGPIAATNRATTNVFSGRFQQGIPAGSPGTNAATFGQLTSASGQEGFASGRNSAANGNWANASGFATTAGGIAANARNYSTTANGNYSDSSGFSTFTSGTASMVAGDTAFVSANNAFLWDGDPLTDSTNATAGSFMLNAPGGINLVGGVISGNGSGLTNIGAASIASVWASNIFAGGGLNLPTATFNVLTATNLSVFGDITANTIANNPGGGIIGTFIGDGSGLSNVSGVVSASTNTLYPTDLSNRELWLPHSISLGTNSSSGPNGVMSSTLGSGFFSWKQPSLGDENQSRILLGASATAANTTYQFFNAKARTNSAYAEVSSFAPSGITAIGRLRTGGSDVAVDSGGGTNVELILQARRDGLETLVRLHPTPTNSAQTPFHFDTFATRTGGTLFGVSNNAAHRFSISDAGDVGFAGALTGDGSGLTNLPLVWSLDLDAHILTLLDNEGGPSARIEPDVFLLSDHSSLFFPSLSNSTLFVGIGNYPFQGSFFTNFSMAVGIGLSPLGNANVTNGNNFLAIGQGCLTDLVASDSTDITAIGDATASSLTVKNSSELFAFGHSALASSTLSNVTDIICIGDSALQSATLSDSGHILALGHAAGVGSYGVFNNVLLLGASANVGAATPATIDNSVALGATASITKSAQMVLGNGITEFVFNGAALTADGSAFTFSLPVAGDGGGLTNLNASSLASGTVADARLSGNVITNTETQNVVLSGVSNNILGDLTVGGTNRVTKLRVGGAAETADAVNITGALRTSANATLGTYLLAGSDIQAGVGTTGNTFQWASGPKLFAPSAGSFAITSNSMATGSAALAATTVSNWPTLYISGASNAPTWNFASNGTFSGSITATNGVASYASAATIAITATGWTNSYTVNAVVDFHASIADLQWYIKNSAGTGVYTNVTGLAAHATAILQPGGALVITAGTTPAGTARQF